MKMVTDNTTVLLYEEQPDQIGWRMTQGPYIALGVIREAVENYGVQFVDLKLETQRDTCEQQQEVQREQCPNDMGKTTLDAAAEVVNTLIESAVQHGFIEDPDQFDQPEQQGQEGTPTVRDNPIGTPVSNEEHDSNRSEGRDTSILPPIINYIKVNTT